MPRTPPSLVDGPYRTPDSLYFAKIYWNCWNLMNYILEYIALYVLLFLYVSLPLDSQIARLEVLALEKGDSVRIPDTSGGGL